MPLTWLTDRFPPIVVEPEKVELLPMKPKLTPKFTWSCEPLPWVTDRLPPIVVGHEKSAVKVVKIHVKIHLVLGAVALGYGHIAGNRSPGHTHQVPLPLPWAKDTLPPIVVGHEKLEPLKLPRFSPKITWSPAPGPWLTDRLPWIVVGHERRAVEIGIIHTKIHQVVLVLRTVALGNGQVAANRGRGQKEEEKCWQNSRRNSPGPGCPRPGSPTDCRGSWRGPRTRSY